MTTETIVRLLPVVRFREFPFGTSADPSMREFVGDQPWSDQENVLDYLRSGRVLGITMGADLTDWLDRTNKANPIISEQREGGATPMTDGVYFWYAGLIYFVEKYNLRIPREFIDHAARANWHVALELDPECRYDYSYFA